MFLSRASAFFNYIIERENIRLRKEADTSIGFDENKWTFDPILSMYKFTNVRRHHDKTSSKLRESFYSKIQSDDKKTILMNCATFRYFGTWEFAEAVGWQTFDAYDFELVKSVAKERFAENLRVFTGAYVITNQGISEPKEEVVVDYFLRALHEKAGRLVDIASKTQSWRLTAEEMMKINGFGGTGFMTKEILLDTTYCPFWAVTDETPDGRFTFPKDWWDWTPIGPGALRGAARILDELADISKKMSNSKAMSILMTLFEEQSNYLPDGFPYLSPTDIQFSLCEFDKYERVRLGQGKPRSRYFPK
jgi:hypothetical protein